MLATAVCLYPVHLLYNQPGGVTDLSIYLLVLWSSSFLCCTSLPDLTTLLSKTLTCTATQTCLSLLWTVQHKVIHTLAFPSHTWSRQSLISHHMPSLCRSSTPSSTCPSFPTTNTATFLHGTCLSRNNNFKTLTHCWKTTAILL